ncbi:MAG TPA: hypothetical protein VK116_01185 [Planctomycetota bacterium]|nr:hypothetical protein [Planctomycetota bacterium]
MVAFEEDREPDEIGGRAAEFEDFKRDLCRDKRNPLDRLAEPTSGLDRVLRKMVSVSELLGKLENARGDAGSDLLSRG